jgi:uncharacterized protein YceH (UPF0502 family)
LLGVLIEKAKTVPAAYPMTVNAIVTGCNQKSNRDPAMSLSDDDVERVLQELQDLGVVTEAYESTRTAKFRHRAYDWLGVSRAELAVLTELLLRGEQTLGDLRARAARMEPIEDLAALEPLVKALLGRGLMIELTPSGRGQVVSHNLYKQPELVALRAKYANHDPSVDPERNAERVPLSPDRGSSLESCHASSRRRRRGRRDRTSGSRHLPPERNASPDSPRASPRCGRTSPGSRPTWTIWNRGSSHDPVERARCSRRIRGASQRCYLRRPMIVFNGIGKAYGGQVLFVDASFQLNPGEKAGLVGPNGSGKTTLFRMIVGEEFPDEGEVSIPKRVSIGYFRQDVGEMSGRSVLDEAIAGSGDLGDLTTS